LLDYILNVFQQKAWGKLEVLSLILSTEKKKKEAGHWWLVPVILATQEQRLGGSWFEASPGKKFLRPYLNQ
jgi:hypothetical protein